MQRNDKRIRRFKEFFTRWNGKRKVYRGVKDRLFRFLFMQEYQNLMEQVEQGLYGSRQIPLPTPQCVVFYNGTQREPEEQILNLSDAFINKDREADLELRVRMLNINYGHNKELMEKCHVLKEYAMFVNISRQYMEQGLPRQEAMESAIQYCIEQGILAETLTKYRAEVLGMILEEFDREKYERTIREDGREEGRKIGQERVNRLNQILIEQNRIEALKRSTCDSEYQKTLFKEFDI